MSTELTLAAQDGEPVLTLAPYDAEPVFILSEDGVRLCYSSVGAGLPLVCSNGIGVSTVFWKYVARDFRHAHRVVTWDYRGHGNSETPPRGADLSVARNADDLVSVLDHAGIERAVLLGHSMGVQVILECYRRHPDRVAALIPVLGTYGHPVNTFYGSKRSYEIFRWSYTLATRFPEQMRAMSKRLARGRPAFEFARLTGMIHTDRIDHGDLDAYLEHITQVDPYLFFSMALQVQAHSAEDILEAVAVPTLVIAGEDDRFTPMECSLRMKMKIPGAELLVIPRGSHAALIEQPELMNGRIRDFLARRLEGRSTHPDSTL